MTRRLSGGFRVALEPGSAVSAAELPASLAGVDVVFMNEAEAAAYLGVRSIAVPQAALALVERGAARAVVTRGERGCVVADGGIVEVAAVPATPVDVTGAGDAVIAGALSGLVRGASLVEAVRVGAVLAALTVETMGSVRADLSPELIEARRAPAAR
jgi:pseudouridine kinase